MLEEDFGEIWKVERERECVGNGYFGERYESLIVNVTRTEMSFE